MTTRNTEINWRSSGGVFRENEFMQLVIPSDCIKEINFERKFKEIRTGIDQVLRIMEPTGKMEIKILVDLSNKQMQFATSNIPFDRQIELEDNYTIIDWLEIING